MAAPGFLRLAGRARWTIVLLAATIVGDVLGMAFDLWDASLLTRVLDGGTVSAAELSASNSRQAADALLDFALLVATGIAFIAWFHSAYRNLECLGVNVLRFRPGWAIGGWFVPILCLWRPRQIADDIWRGSDPDAPASQGAEWQARPVPNLVKLWWGLWIVGTFAGSIAARTVFTADTTAALRDSDRLDTFTLGIDVVGAVLAILVVRELTRRQEERRRRLELA